MIKKVRLISALALLAVASLAAAAVRAETVVPFDNVTLLQHTELVGGESGTALGFLVPKAGSVSVSLADLSWPEAFDSLSVMIVKGISVLGSLSGAGEFSFDATSPGKYFALVLSDAKGELDLGLYSLNIKFNSLTAPVPLPAAAWLLMAGVSGLGAVVRRRRALPMV